MRVLIAGESWITHSTHIKGVDHFTLSSYQVGVTPLLSALNHGGHTVTHLPAHEVPGKFPSGAELHAYDVIILSDIGANSVQLHPMVVERSLSYPNRLQSLADWVVAGGGLLMVGGYLSFTGIGAKAAYHCTPVEKILPVLCLPFDDRVECTQGINPTVVRGEHAVVLGMEPTWPVLLGYNRVTLREDAELLVKIGDDPLLAVRQVGNGRTGAFTSDCSPHWAPASFCEEWDGYFRLFNGLVKWLGRDAGDSGAVQLGPP